MVAVGIVVGIDVEISIFIDDIGMVEGSNIIVDSVIKLVTDVGETNPVVTLTLLSAIQCKYIHTIHM